MNITPLEGQAAKSTIGSVLAESMTSIERDDKRPTLLQRSRLDFFPLISAIIKRKKKQKKQQQQQQQDTRTIGSKESTENSCRKETIRRQFKLTEHMNQMITDQGQEVCDKKEISTEIGIFYQKLYIKKKKKLDSNCRNGIKNSNTKKC